VPGILLETTRQADLQPLKVNGVSVFQKLGQIRVELARALSSEHVQLFAEPNPDPTTGDIQWYAPVGGGAIRLKDADAATQAAAQATLARLIDDITGYTDRLRRSGNDADHLFANFLTLAIEIPADDHIFLVGNRPVISGWGHVPNGPATPHQLLIALSRRVAQQSRPQAAPPSPPPVSPTLGPAAASSGAAGAQAEPLAGAPGEPTRYRLVVRPAVVRSLPALAGAPTWLAALLWLLFVLLLLVIGYLLLKHCALGRPFGGYDLRFAIVNYCSAPAAVAEAPPPATDSRQAALLDNLARLERRLADQRRACTVPRPNSNQQPGNTARQRVLDEGGRIGKVNLILTWNTDDDLDLHVICPNGTRIYFGNQQACGAVHDVDRNRSQTSLSPQPVENMVWNDDSTMPGEFTVQVDRYKSRSSGSAGTEFTVELRVDDQTVRTERGIAEGEKSPKQVFTFRLPYPRSGNSGPPAQNAPAPNR